MRPRIAAGLVGIAIAFAARSARAYRPFDGTDADVADHGDFELELGPTQVLHYDHRSYLEAPATVLNYGLLPGWEIVADLRDQIPLEAGRTTFVDNDLLLKYVIREGVLQDKTGISLATEFGVLFPNLGPNAEIGATHDFGFADNVIASYRVPWMTMHLNSQIALDRNLRADWFESLILEGPWTWTVRPVAEGSLEKEWGGAFARSILGGAIARVNDEFAIDLGVRAFQDDGANGYEVRFGITWAVPFVRYPKAHVDDEGPHASNARAVALALP